MVPLFSNLESGLLFFPSDIENETDLVNEKSG